MSQNQEHTETALPIQHSNDALRESSVMPGIIKAMNHEADPREISDAMEAMDITPEAAYHKIEGTVVGGYQKIEAAVVGSYHKVEDAVVGAYRKVEDHFVGKFLTRDGESVEDAKERMKNPEK